MCRAKDIGNRYAIPTGVGAINVCDGEGGTGGIRDGDPAAIGILIFLPLVGGGTGGIHIKGSGGPDGGNGISRLGGDGGWWRQFQGV